MSNFWWILKLELCDLMCFLWFEKLCASFGVVLSVADRSPVKEDILAQQAASTQQAAPSVEIPDDYAMLEGKKDVPNGVQHPAIETDWPWVTFEWPWYVSPLYWHILDLCSICFLCWHFMFNIMHANLDGAAKCTHMQGLLFTLCIYYLEYCF